MKEEFIKFVEELMKQNPTVTKQLYTENIRVYFEAMKNPAESPKSGEVTKAGVPILKCLQDEIKTLGHKKGYKASDIAQIMGISPKGVSGSIRKLVTDGYVEKVEDTKPAIYLLTDKGEKYIIND